MTGKYRQIPSQRRNQRIRFNDEELRTLLERCAAADAAALRQLYELVSPVLLACLMRILRRMALAEEVLQEVFVSIWQRANRFQASRGRPLAWMMAIARYRAFDLLRREKHEPILLGDLKSSPEHEAVVSEQMEDAMIANENLDHGMAVLSAKQERCLRLFAEGHSHGSIAQITGSPLGTVKSLIRRGHLILRDGAQSARLPSVASEAAWRPSPAWGSTWMCAPEPLRSTPPRKRRRSAYSAGARQDLSNECGLQSKYGGQRG